MNEFELIEKYFSSNAIKNKELKKGVGDDAALFVVPEQYELAVSVDAMVEGQHFFADVNPRSLGHKILAVSLSDMAAMGAIPKFVLLSATLPEVDTSWLSGFTTGFFDLANQYDVDLIGGNTAKGPLNLTSVIHGYVAKGQALTRDAAKVNDLICVTGTLGDAGKALQQIKHNHTVDPFLKKRFDCPTPRVKAGLLLREFATACIDLSDGLLQDLTKILDASGVGAYITLDSLPLSDALLKNTNRPVAQQLALSAGEDYELCFTVPENKLNDLKSKMTPNNESFTVIGRIIKEKTCVVLDESGNAVNIEQSGFDHFG